MLKFKLLTLAILITSLSVSAEEASYDMVNDRIVLSGIYKANTKRGALAHIAETLKNTDSSSDKLIHKVMLKDKDGKSYEKIVFQYNPKRKIAIINADLMIKEALIIGNLDDSFKPVNYYNEKSSGSPDEILVIKGGHSLINTGIFCLYESKIIAYKRKQPFKFDKPGTQFKAYNAVLNGFSQPITLRRNNTISIVNSEIANFDTFVCDPWATFPKARLQVSGCLARNGKTLGFFYHSLGKTLFSHNKMDNVNTSFRLLAGSVNVFDTPYKNSIIAMDKFKTSSLKVMQKLTLVYGTKALGKIKVEGIDKIGNVGFVKEFTSTKPGELELMVPIKKLHSLETGKGLIETKTLVPYKITISVGSKEQQYKMMFDKAESITIQ